jgi:PAS domain S-box-containing protein
MPPKRKQKPKPASLKKAAFKKFAEAGTVSTSITTKQLASLRESERQLKIVLGAAPFGIWEWNIATNQTRWAGKVFEIFQLSAKAFEEAYEKYLQLVHPEDRIKLANAIQQALESNTKEYFIEHRITRPDGKQRWLEVSATIKRNKKGIATKMAGFVHDITDRKEVERDREDWKVRHELISSSAGLVIYDYDIPSGNIIWSGNSEELLGYRPAELGDIARWERLMHPDDREYAARQLEAAQHSKSAYDVYYRFRKKNGDYAYMHDRGFFVAGIEGKAERMLGMMNDVTERFRAQESLKESESRFRLLQQASFGGIGLHDKGKILDCNQGLCDITGYSYQELIGSNGLDLIAPEWRDFVYEKIVSGYDKTYDVEGIRKDGSKYFLEIRGKNMPFEGKIIRVTEFRDITERKLNEEKIEEQNRKLISAAEELRRKNHQLQEFTQIVSHNLRSPVGNILTLANFYENASTEQEKNEYVALLKESGSTTLTMLNELNEVLKIKQDKNIIKQNIHFEKVLHQVTSMLTARITEVKAQITFNFSAAPVILYPSIYLESIILNLLDNALKYHSMERLPEIALETTADADGNILLAVRDNGLGINLERYKHQVFKLRKTFHNHPESRGIGLFMIKNQIEAMGGSISVESTENVGTTFFVNFSKTHQDGR